MKRGTIPRKQGEEWRLVKGTDDYWISNYARFRRNNKILKQSPDKDGYLTCNIGHKRMRTSRLVAQAFVPNPFNKPIVDHIDGCKQNNLPSNLRWVTRSENTQAAWDLGLIKKKENMPVLVLDEDNNARLFESQTAAAKAIKADDKIVNQVCRGIKKTVKGFRIFKIRSLLDERSESEKDLLSL